MCLLLVKPVEAPAITPVVQEKPYISTNPTRFYKNNNIGLVTVGSHQQPGQVLTLNTGPGIERLALRAGDQVIVEFSPNYTIRWVSKKS